MDYGVYKNGLDFKESDRPVFMHKRVAGGPHRPEGIHQVSGPPSHEKSEGGSESIGDQPLLRASDMHELRLAHETANMILNAEMKLRDSIMRKESRFSLYPLDYPDVDSEKWDCWINIYKGNDSLMKLEKQPFSTVFPLGTS